MAFLSDGWLARRKSKESSGHDRVIDTVPECPYHHQGLWIARSSDTRSSIWRMSTNMIPIIDTHQHLWDLSRLSLPWIKGLELMERSYIMADYLKASADTGIAASIYMEVDVKTGLRDREIQDVTEHCSRPDILMKGIVISGDPDSLEFDSYLDRHSGNEFIKGVRRVLHVDEARPGHCVTPHFVDGVKELGRRRLLFSICMRPSELHDAIDLAKQCPDTVFVLDHCGNADPYVVNGQRDPGSGPGESDSWYWHTRQGWIDAITELGLQPNVVCKISGIVARVREDWSAETLAPTIDACLDAFGSERVIFGGDWPVCLNRASLPEWVGAFREVLSRRDVAFQHHAMHANAERIYGVSL